MKDIFVIENERMVFLDIKITFANYGLNAVHANLHNIESLLSSGFMPGLIIADVHTATGIFKKLWKALKTNEGYKGIPVILTNSGRPVFERLCLQTKINVIARLEKPYNTDDLLTIYRQYLMHRYEINRFEAAEFSFEELVMS
jgi:DNA-binding NtrC family response regulator